MLKVLLQKNKIKKKEKTPNKPNTLKDQRQTFLYVETKEIKLVTRNNCISHNSNFRSLGLSGISRMTLYSYLILILRTNNMLCEKVLLYILSPYIFKKENSILVKTAVQKTVVFYLHTKNAKYWQNHHIINRTLLWTWEREDNRIQLALFMQGFPLLERLPK